MDAADLLDRSFAELHMQMRIRRVVIADGADELASGNVGAGHDRRVDAGKMKVDVVYEPIDRIVNADDDMPRREAA